ncbi:MAG: META domain-containing protein [Caldilineaceae bacterium]|nr:META domain-containing protein [Caldilineaceae bacterium]
MMTDQDPINRAPMNQDPTAQDSVTQESPAGSTDPYALNDQTAQTNGSGQNPLVIAALVLAALALVIAAFLLFSNRGNDSAGPGPEQPVPTLEVQTPAPGVPTGTITANLGANVRSGPDTSYPVIGGLPKDARVEIIGRSADSGWWALRIPSLVNGQGWVAAELVVAENADNVPVIPAPDAPAPTATAVATILFDVDAKAINAGECTTLRWKVENVKEVYVYPTGEAWDNYPEAGEGSREVCPTTTATYEMRVVRADDTVELQQVTIEVANTNPLAATSWTVAALQVNQVPIPDSQLTLAFDDAGGASGSAGCNNFQGTYTVTSDGLVFGPLAATERSCGEELDSQEQLFLGLLRATATFALVDNQLVLFDGAGLETVRLNQARDN